MQHLLALKRFVASGRTEALARDCVRRGQVLSLEQIPTGSLLALSYLFDHRLFAFVLCLQEATSSCRTTSASRRQKIL